MTKGEIQIGAWIIWPGDTWPYPRQIIAETTKRWRVSGLEDDRKPYSKSNPYTRSLENVLFSQLQAARLCRKEEIPLEFRIYHPEIY